MEAFNSNGFKQKANYSVLWESAHSKREVDTAWTVGVEKRKFIFG